MKIVFLPYFPENPYQDILASHLRKIGADVKNWTHFKRFPVIKSIKEQGKPECIHIHWLHPLLIGSTLFITIIKASTFLIEILIAKILQISKSKVYQLIQRNEIQSVRINRNVRIRQEDLEEFISKKIG